MKKLSILLVALMPVLFLVSCDKPGKETAKKISKVYYEDEDGDLFLSSSYVWNNKLVSAVTYYYQTGEVGAVFSYTYNNKDEVTEMRYREYSEDDDQNYLSELVYKVARENDKMTVTGYDGDEAFIQYEYYYTDGKISQVDITPSLQKSGKGGAAGKSLFKPRFQYPLAVNMPEGQPKVGKGEAVMSYTYIYTDGNVTMVLFNEFGNEGEATLVFDQAPNPFCNLFDQFGSLDYTIVSKNNMTQMLDQTGVVRIEYEYTYDKDNYPVRKANARWGDANVFEYIK